MLTVGARAPEIAALDHRGHKLLLSELVQHGPVVVYFYPKDFTPGCTLESCEFRDSWEALSPHDVTIVGISFDDDDTHKRFAAKHKLPFSLVSDRDKAIATAYDVVGFFGLFPRRVTYVIGKNQEILGVFHHELRIRKHASSVAALLGISLE